MKLLILWRAVVDRVEAPEVLEIPEQDQTGSCSQHF